MNLKTKRSLLMTIILVAVVSLAFACKKVENSSVSIANATVAEIQVDGLACEACVLGLRSSLKDTPGVIDCSLSYQSGKGKLYIRKGVDLNEQKIRETVQESGFKLVRLAWLRK